MSTTTPAMQPTQGLELRRRVVRRIVQIFGQVIFGGALLVISAGKLDWVWAWVYVGVSFAALITMLLIMLPGHEEIVAERSRFGPDTKSWDRKLMGAMILPGLATYVVAGLDERFGWVGGWPTTVHVIGTVAFVLSYSLSGWAMATNRFFTTTVRIQKDGGHTAVMDGPYRLVRHPGYLSFLITMAATSFMLGSAWALIPAAISIALMVVRTALEDRTLQAELPGYKEYTQKTRYRLLPGAW